MDWIKWANEIHENAVGHGWWDEERTAAEIVCLIHSELSEALEEYRNNRPMVYGLVIQGDDKDTPYIETDMGVIRERGLKPEGIAVELVDAVIRILDWFGYNGETDMPTLDRVGYSFDPEEDFPTMLAYCHKAVSDAMEDYGTETDDYYLVVTVLYIRDWLEFRGIDLEEIVELKHEYNKTRPYRHGGKRI